jgi:hypothetical protein
MSQTLSLTGTFRSAARRDLVHRATVRHFGIYLPASMVEVSRSRLTPEAEGELVGYHRAWRMRWGCSRTLSTRADCISSCIDPVFWQRGLVLGPLRRCLIKMFIFLFRRSAPDASACATRPLMTIAEGVAVADNFNLLVTSAIVAYRESPVIDNPGASKVTFQTSPESPRRRS